MHIRTYVKCTCTCTGILTTIYLSITDYRPHPLMVHRRPSNQRGTQAAKRKASEELNSKLLVNSLSSSTPTPRPVLYLQSFYFLWFIWQTQPTDETGQYMALLLCISARKGVHVQEGIQLGYCMLSWYCWDALFFALIHGPMSHSRFEAVPIHWRLPV